MTAYLGLEAVDLDQVLFGDVVGHQKRRHIFALVALQLDDFPQLCVLHNCPVAAELCDTTMTDLRQLSLELTISEQL